MCLIAAVDSRIVLYVAHRRASNKPTMCFFQQKGLSLDRLAVTGQALTGICLSDNLIDLKNKNLAGQQPVASSIDPCLKHQIFYFILNNRDLHVDLEHILILKHAMLCMALTRTSAVVYNIRL